MTAQVETSSRPFLTAAEGAERVASPRESTRQSWPSDLNVSTTRLFAKPGGTCVRESADSTVLRSTSGSLDGATQSSASPHDTVAQHSRMPSRPTSGPAVRVGRHVFLPRGFDQRRALSHCPAPPPPPPRRTASTTSTATHSLNHDCAKSPDRDDRVYAVVPQMPLNSRVTPQVVPSRGARRQRLRPVLHPSAVPLPSAAAALRARLRARTVNQPKTERPFAHAHGDAATAEPPSEFLRFLGGAAVNDAPLPSFLPSLSLVGGDVHVCSADNCRFRVVFAHGATPPWASTVAAAEVTVLDDSVRSLLQPPPLLRVETDRVNGSEASKPIHSSPRPPNHILGPQVDACGRPAWGFPVDRELCLTPPSVPVSNMSAINQELARHYSTALDSDMLGGATPTPLYPAHGVLSPPPPQMTSPATTGNADGRAVATDAVLSDSTRAAAPSHFMADGWKRYSTVAALYMAVAAGHGCSPASLPFVSVQLVPANALLTDAVRMEMRLSSAPTGASGAASLALRRAKLAQRAQTSSVVPNDDWLPVAVERAVPRKGTANGAMLAGRALSMQSSPFSDAEVFQLLYLQLLFRKFFDIRFAHLIETTNPDDAVPGTHTEAGAWWTRTDYIGLGGQAAHGIAIEHPSDPTRCLFFPPFSRLIVLLGLEQAVVPMYASAEALQQTSRLPLAGSTPDMLCTGRTGHAAVRWAWTQDINSPMAATYALEGLFEQFESAYGCTRRDLRRAGVSPVLLQCGEDTVMQTLQRDFTDLSRFFVPPETRLPLSQQGPVDTLVGGVMTANTSFIPATAQSTAPGVASSARGEEALENASIFSVINTPPMSAAASARAELKADQPEAMMPTAATTSPLLNSQLDKPATPNALTPLIRPPTPTPSLGGDSLGATVRAEDVLPMSPFTKQESLVTRWRHYIQTGLVSIFDGLTVGIELQGFIGKGGSGLVYRGVYGRRRLPVAVKVFVIPDGMSHDDYVRESLTDVAFYVLLNQLDDFAICHAGRAHDFIVSAVPPKGLPEEDAETARRGADASTTRLCYLVTDLMDGTLGRFLREDEDDYDPCYDTLINSPLRDVELFQFLFLQLACKCLFDWRVLDLMLNGQLRGDNLGFRYPYTLDSEPDAARDAYDGLFITYQVDPEAEVKHLRFPMRLDLQDPAQVAHGPLRLIFFIDLGQGMQPNVAELTNHKFIGETVVESCVQEDGFGRYWPPDELYCRYVEVVGEHAQEVSAWGSQVRLRSQEDAVAALTALFELYAPMYGCDALSPEERPRFLQLTWSPASVAELKKAYVYRAGI